jgi:mRNA interferase MazF
MTEGDIVLAPLVQSDDSVKNRPALVLRELPPFGDFLVCGVSTQVRHAVPGFDEVVRKTDPEFTATGLLADSVVRLGFLAVLSRRNVLGTIGEIGADRHTRLLKNLSAYLVANLK